MSYLSGIVIIVLTVAVMELVAWSSHKYVMHGFGWGWHRDHHERHDGFFEKNDLYAAVGAGISVGFFAVGSPLIMGASAWAPGTWIGLGVLAYGVIYSLIHDGLVHQRWFQWVPRKGYARRLVQAHRLHHATVGKEGGVSFGFLYARDPVRLKQELAAQRDRGEAVLRDSEQSG